MRILHLSDLHLPVPRALLPFRIGVHPKRLIGWLNLRLRREPSFRDGLRRLAQWVDYARVAKPDMILFTGDVCTLGSEAELRWCRAAIEPLMAAAPLFYGLPGNHDVYVSRTAWNRFFGDLCPVPGNPADWPRRCSPGENLQLLLLDSTRPLHLPFSNGRIPDSALDRLQAQLQSGSGFRLVAMHHGLWHENGQPDIPTHGLLNRRRLVSLLDNQPRCALLHGHMHRGFALLQDRFPPVFCAGSATQRNRSGAWLFDVRSGSLNAKRLHCHGNEIVANDLAI